ncbi:hypothetical protein CGCF415_v001002 [Colletotrichum fructicola]|nr:hypothetical protein CGCF415_v001002 [Colletotrichum fructicola]KAF4941623.1 hypothetical protein CGCF245_v001296 [Colletotrichum fructicola]
MRNGLHQHALAHLVARDRPFALGQGPASPAASRQAVERSTACLSGSSAIVRNPTCTAHHEFASAADSVTNADVVARRAAVRNRAPKSQPDIAEPTVDGFQRTYIGIVLSSDDDGAMMAQSLFCRRQ